MKRFRAYKTFHRVFKHIYFGSQNSSILVHLLLNGLKYKLHLFKANKASLKKVKT